MVVRHETIICKRARCFTRFNNRNASQYSSEGFGGFQNTYFYRHLFIQAICTNRRNENRGDKMNSHLSTLNLVMSILAYPYYKVKKTFEFGCGDFSTPFFLDRSENHIAAETTGHSNEARSFEWYGKIKNQYGNRLLNIFISSIEGNFKILEKEQPDLVFVDGADFRSRMVNESFKHTSVVIAHDTEAIGYGWENVEMPIGWTRHSRASKTIPDPDGAWTTVWTSNHMLSTALTGIGLSSCPIPRRA